MNPLSWARPRSRGECAAPEHRKSVPGVWLDVLKIIRSKALFCGYKLKKFVKPDRLNLGVGMYQS